MSYTYLKNKVASIDFRKTDPHKSGISCRYIRLTKKYGVKLYGKKKDRDATVFRQRLAHSFGFGPKVVMLIKRNKDYGYITEHAEERVSSDELLKICNFARLVGWSSSDMEEDRNVGTINGNPVIIDFDDATLLC